MIEIDLFGHNSEEVVKFVRSRSLKRDVFRQEEFSHNHEGRDDFYGRFSFDDADSRLVSQALTYFGLRPFDYEIVRGHFSRHSGYDLSSKRV